MLWDVDVLLCCCAGADSDVHVWMCECVRVDRIFVFSEWIEPDFF